MQQKTDTERMILFRQLGEMLTLKKALLPVSWLALE